MIFIIIYQGQPESGCEANGEFVTDSEKKAAVMKSDEMAATV